MTTEQKLVNYISKISRELLIIQPHQARDIMLICAQQALGQVKFYRYDTNNFSGKKAGAWIFQRMHDLEETIIENVLLSDKIVLTEPEIERRFYKYECLDSKGVMKGIIYTSNNQIF